MSDWIHNNKVTAQTASLSVKLIRLCCCLTSPASHKIILNLNQVLHASVCECSAVCVACVCGCWEDVSLQLLMALHYTLQLNYSFFQQ